jgi:hypothetical protein
MDDDRLCIFYAKQPLVAKGIWLFHLVDDKYNLLFNDKNRPKILMKNKETMVTLIRNASVIGFVD